MPRTPKRPIVFTNCAMFSFWEIYFPDFFFQTLRKWPGSWVNNLGISASDMLGRKQCLKIEVLKVYFYHNNVLHRRSCWTESLQQSVNSIGYLLPTTVPSPTTKYFTHVRPVFISAPDFLAGPVEYFPSQPGLHSGWRSGWIMHNGFGPHRPELSRQKTTKQITSPNWKNKLVLWAYGSLILFYLVS